MNSNFVIRQEHGETLLMEDGEIHAQIFRSGLPYADKFAAAPEMYQALKAYAAESKHCDCELCRVVRKALAKAEGDSK